VALPVNDVNIHARVAGELPQQRGLPHSKRVG
jgi:hypothetical protein